MSLRKAINAKCRDCICDPLDKGTPAQQIAACTDKACPLRPVRPVTCTKLPARLLRHWCIDPDDLCDRARPLVTDDETAPEISVEGQDGQLQEQSLPA